MRSFLGLTVVYLGFFTAVGLIAGVFTSWWQTPEDSTLPFVAAAAVVSLLLLVPRAFGREPIRRFEAGGKWANEHPLGASAILGLALFVFSLTWGLAADEPLTTNFAWSLGGAAALLAGLILLAFGERFVRRREARKRGIAPQDYKPGKLARRLGLTLAVLVGTFVALGLGVDLADMIG